MAGIRINNHSQVPFKVHAKCEIASGSITIDIYQVESNILLPTVAAKDGDDPGFIEPQPEWVTAPLACAKCGWEIASSDKFCVNCGAKLE